MYQPYPAGAQLPEVQRPPIPSQVANAVKVMYIGAAGTVRLCGLVTWLVGLTAVILLWQRSSTAYFKPVTAR
jgi:hypothetical protein